MRNEFNRWWRGFALLAILAMAGCGGAAAVQTADISGTVTLDGKPLAGVDVIFFHEESGFSGVGRTDSQGKYTLAQGAAVGNNKVSMRAAPRGGGDGDDMFGGDEDSGLDEGQLEAAGGVPDDTVNPGGEKTGEDLVPEQYQTESSILTFTVTSAGSPSADFKLTTSN